MSADWLWSPFSHTRWTTVGMLFLILAVVTIVKRRPFLALASAMGWLVAFEIAYEVTNVVMLARSRPRLVTNNG